MHWGASERPALCCSVVRLWAAQNKHLCALDFLPRFTRGCSLEKYVGSCEQIRFMDFECWKTTAGQKTSCLAGADV